MHFTCISPEVSPLVAFKQIRYLKLQRSVGKANLSLLIEHSAQNLVASVPGGSVFQKPWNIHACLYVTGFVQPACLDCACPRCWKEGFCPAEVPVLNSLPLGEIYVGLRSGHNHCTSCALSTAQNISCTAHAASLCALQKAAVIVMQPDARAGLVP